MIYYATCIKGASALFIMYACYVCVFVCMYTCMYVCSQFSEQPANGL